LSLQRRLLHINWSLFIGSSLLLYGNYQVSKTIASYAVVVDAIDQQAKKVYLKYEFLELTDTSRLFLPMKTIQTLVDL
jgi:hypothetical protein